MVDTVKLAAYIAAMPGLTGGTTGAAILAYLGATNVTVEKPIEPLDWMTWASSENITYKVAVECAAFRAGTSVRTNSQIGSFLWLEHLFNAAGGGIAMDKDEARSAINNIVGEGLSIANRTALLALSNDVVTLRADSLGTLDDASALVYIAQERP